MSGPPAMLDAPQPLTLEEAESIAIASHPAIAEQQAMIRAARGECLQVGLAPNPTAGYTASEVGNEGNAGQQGLYVGQQFIRGNKLQLNRQVASQQVHVLEQQLTAEMLRVRTRVRIALYKVLLTQRQVDLTTGLVDVSKQAAKTVSDLFDAKEARRLDVLQAQIESDRILVKLRQAEANRDAAWRELAVAMGQPTTARRDVQADLESLGWAYDWDTSRQMLLEGSPELAALMMDVERARAAVARACAEPISDVSAQVSVQYDDSTEDTVTGIQVGMPIPIWNRNQGGIAKARNELTAAQRRLEAYELQLTSQLAEKLRQYSAAKAQADAYRGGILQRAEENLSLTRESYQAGESNYLELLTVQRTYFESNLDYLGSLGEVNRSVQLLNGFLLGEPTE
ncbi:TolC family protein [Aeoliella mucimassa]|uniref:TolC family protein n=1 Tax=Aeoliella mucimassa TaxID=2527972 RepID=UPI001E2A175E|nr:TolC family protein [Aeoliella mucimassa]